MATSSKAMRAIWHAGSRKLFFEARKHLLQQLLRNFPYAFTVVARNRPNIRVRPLSSKYAGGSRAIVVGDIKASEQFAATSISMLNIFDENCDEPLKSRTRAYRHTALRRTLRLYQRADEALEDQV